jgi:hypothetical protein
MQNMRFVNFRYRQPWDKPLWLTPPHTTVTATMFMMPKGMVSIATGRLAQNRVYQPRLRFKCHGAGYCGLV